LGEEIGGGDWGRRLGEENWFPREETPATGEESEFPLEENLGG
jgi:hypothetical protein